MIKQDYKFKTKPYDHQHHWFLATRDLEYHGFLWEPGTGKSKVDIDSSAYQYVTGKIDAWIIVAPKGVHRNWYRVQIPTHMPDYIPLIMQCWPKYNEKDFFKGQGFRIFCINIDAFRSKKGLAAVYTILNSYRCKVTVDESSKIKHANSIRTKEILKIRKKAKIRRIITGTPFTGTPFDGYPQLKFLDDSLVPGSFQCYKSRYALMCDDTDRKFAAIKKRLPVKSQKFFQMVKEDDDGRPIYQNLDELTDIVYSCCSRVLKAECFDLPPKVYESIFVELSPEQKRWYKDVERKIQVECEKLGKRITTEIVLTKWLRLQQIIGGFIKFDEDKYPTMLGKSWKDIPRMVDMMDALEDCSGKAIIWARFQPELDMIYEALREGYGEESIAQYHGRIKDKDRALGIDLFQDEWVNKKGVREHKPSKVKWFLGQQQAGGYGLTLTQAEDMFYYSNMFDYEVRTQSEDRAHRAGLDHKVRYTDLFAEDTIDEIIALALENHQNVADTITGDKVKYMDMMVLDWTKKQQGRR